jgi:hypothetical protein
MEDIYRKIPLEKIPWNIENPPDALIGLVERGQVFPRGTIESGCSAGNYAVWLSKQGFIVDGIDIALSAIGFAREHAREHGVSCTFWLSICWEILTRWRGSLILPLTWNYCTPQSSRIGSGL